MSILHVLTPNICTSEQELMPQDTSISRLKSPVRIPSLSGFYFLLAQEPIEIDHSSHFLSDKSKHMACKHSDWLETNYCMKIQNHLFTLVS